MDASAKHTSGSSSTPKAFLSFIFCSLSPSDAAESDKSSLTKMTLSRDHTAKSGVLNISF
ncbi:hypothetical protein D3C85_677630 [compost metagenome]